MIRLFALDMKDMPDPAENEILLNQLSPLRKERVLKCSQLKGRKEITGAGLLLGQVLPCFGMDETKIFVGKNGKPEIDGFYFNISHSGGMVICAAGEKAVGCDIETLSKKPGRVAGRFFTEGEKRYLKGLSDEQQTSGFFRIWTIKESYIKMTGEGLKCPLNSFEVIPGDVVTIVRDKSPVPCFVKEYQMEGYRVSVCSMEKEFTEEIEYMQYEDIIQNYNGVPAFFAR